MNINDKVVLKEDIIVRNKFNNVVSVPKGSEGLIIEEIPKSKLNLVSSIRPYERRRAPRPKRYAFKAPEDLFTEYKVCFLGYGDIIVSSIMLDKMSEDV